MHSTHNQHFITCGDNTVLIANCLFSIYFCSPDDVKIFGETAETTKS